MPVSDYQMEFKGLILGKGTAIGIESISGFEDFDTEQGDVSVPRQWGDIPGLHTVTGKEILLEVHAIGDEALRNVLDTFQPSALPNRLILKDPYAYERFVFARPIGRAMVKNPTHKFKKMVTLRIKAADPRIYSTHQVVANIGQFAPGGGISYDVEYDKEYVEMASTGEAIASNIGNSRAYPVLKIFGPPTGTLDSATVRNITTGQTATFVFDSSLLSSDVLTADMRRIVVADSADVPFIYLGANTNRYGTWQLPREPFYLVPGDNVIRYQTEGTSTDAVAQIAYRHTSL